MVVPTDQIFPVDDPVSRDLRIALHTPGQVELVAVETLHLAGQERGGGVTWSMLHLLANWDSCIPAPTLCSLTRIIYFNQQSHYKPDMSGKDLIETIYLWNSRT